MQDAPWKHQFPQVYQKVRQIPLAKNLPPAQWMALSLENGFISSTEYLPWAQNYYGLATLKSDFFESKHFSLMAYHKFKNQSTTWGPQALPVFEWENTLFVACIDPHSVPSELANHPDMICRPLLANYEDLVKAWNFCLESGTPPPAFNPIASELKIGVPSPDALTGELKTAPPIPPAIESSPTMTASLHKAQQEVQRQTSADIPLIVVTEPPVTPLHEVPNKNSEEVASIGTPSATAKPQKRELNLNPPVPTEDLFELLNSTENPSIQHSPLSAETQHSDIHSRDSIASFEMPEGLNLTVNSELQLKIPSLSQQKNPTPLLQEANKISALPENLSTEDLASIPAPSLSLAPTFSSTTLASASQGTIMPAPINDNPPLARIPTKTAAAASPSIGTAMAPSPSIGAASPTTSPTIATVAKNTSVSNIAESATKSTISMNSPPPLMATPPPISTIQTQELEEELTLGFTKAYQFYRNLMILKIKDNVVIPMRWDPSYKKPKSLQGIPLNQPSIFRIVVRTKKPFHGPVTSNSINDQFIEHWFDGHKPNYLTIHPLFFEKECVGLLLGASDETLDRKDSLHLMESTAEMIEINFGANLAAA